jgi:hypothetical protein
MKVKQETIAVPVELVRELKAKLVHYPSSVVPVGLRTSVSVASLLAAIDKLPDPPKPDVVEECLKASDGEFSNTLGAMRAALRRYRELGCPELDP